MRRVADASMHPFDTARRRCASRRRRRSEPNPPSPMNTPTFLTHDPDSLTPEVAALLPRLADPDPAVRRIAVIALADLEDPDALAPIVDRLRHDASADVRAEAATVLAAWEEGPIVDALCDALLDDDPAVREAAALSLSAVKDASSAPVLCARVEQPESFFVQASVLRALRELRYAEAFAPALCALDHGEASVRIEAIGVLGWLKDTRAIAPLARIATHDPIADLRRVAVGALGFAPPADPATSEALLHALHDSAWQVREEAATTLGKLRAASARDALIAALDDAYWQVRLRATRALGQLGDRTAAAPLAGLLAHAISNLRKEAALALGELREPSTVAALQAALGDGDPEVRKAVRIALRQIEGAAR
jgi:HEAT repeat protein